MNASSVLLAVLLGTSPLAPGDHVRSVEVDGLARTYRVHVPPQPEPSQPRPVVLAFHGAVMTGAMMESFSGLNRTADEAGFVVVYPDAWHQDGWAALWNAGCLGDPQASPPDDVQFVRRLLDDLATVASLDQRRIYATGLSNGAMMCYRLAAEFSERIAAIAPVAGTMALETPRPARPVPVLHFHGTADPLVPYGGLGESPPRMLRFRSVAATIQAWVEIDGCPSTPKTAELPNVANDGTRVVRETYGPGQEDSEVILYRVQGGGHTWPGRPWTLPLLGKTTRDISANDLIWAFFQRHPRP